MLMRRGLTLDVKAVDSEGKIYNIEIENSPQRATPFRARYHSALIDVNTLKSGQQVTELPETYVVFITRTDYFKAGLSHYTVERTITNLNNRAFGDFAHIVYGNGEYRGDDDYGRLMSDLHATDPSEMYFPILADTINSTKQTEKGVRTMGSVLEECYERGREEARKELEQVYQKERAEARKELEQAYQKDLAEARKEAAESRFYGLSNLVAYAKMTVDQAMFMMGIPLSEKSKYEARLKQEGVLA